MTDKVDEALSTLMSAGHSVADARDVLAEYCNDLQDEIERLREAGQVVWDDWGVIRKENERLRAALERIATMTTGDDASGPMRDIAREALND